MHILPQTANNFPATVPVTHLERLPFFLYPSINCRFPGKKTWDSCRETLVPEMSKLRVHDDHLETIITGVQCLITNTINFLV